MTLQLRKIDEKTVDKWLQAIGKLSKNLKVLLGDNLDSVYATESPEVTVRDYNVIIVAKEPVSGEIIEKIYELSARVCEETKSDFAIIPKIVTKNTVEADEYVWELERIGFKVL